MIVLDVETSGTNPEVHSILSIGALDFDEPTNQFYDECRAWGGAMHQPPFGDPETLGTRRGAKLEEEAFRINGFSKEDALDINKKTEAELIEAFIAWATDRVEERTFAAQNVSFDHSFVAAAANRANVDFPFAKRTVDIHTLAWLHMKLKGHIPPTEKHHSALSSSTILTYCGLPEEQKPHNALTGALWHAEVISRIAYNKNLLPDFSSYDIPWMNR